MTNFLKTVASPVSGIISFVNVWTARIRGMVSVCSVTKMFTLTRVWLAGQANRFFRAGGYHGSAVFVVIQDIM